jgi:hypothetical protein
MFDVLEARLNCTVHKKLANAMATIGARTVPVVFDAEYSAATVGAAHIGASAPQMQIIAAMYLPILSAVSLRSWWNAAGGGVACL